MEAANILLHAKAKIIANQQPPQGGLGIGLWVEGIWDFRHLYSFKVHPLNKAFFNMKLVWHVLVN